MGLDMYLNRRVYIGNNSDDGEIVEVTNALGKKTRYNTGKIEYVIERVAYWRKANAIHNWFIENVAGGVDDCSEIEVESSKLKELLDVCRKVSKDHSLAPQLLPTTEGFFFGSQDYDDWYFQDLEHTIKVLESLDLDEDWLAASFTYRASW